MEYAIETLQIELFRCKGMLRTVENNMHEMCTPMQAFDEYENKIKQLEAAIAKLRQP